MTGVTSSALDAAAGLNEGGEPGELARRGSALSQERRFAEALPLLQASLAAEPANPTAWYDLGVCHQSEGLLYQAADCYERCLALLPDHASAHNNLGIIYAGHHNFRDARHHLEQAMARNPGGLARLNLESLGNDEASFDSGVVRCADLPDPPEDKALPRISLCVIAKNEEANLPRLLDSIRATVSEMIVVDTGSTDRTVELAVAAGARVHHFPWIDDFSAARNESLRHATGDWVLVMDADYSVSPADAQKIIRAAASGIADAFFYNVASRQGRGSEPNGCINQQPHLFRNVPGLTYEGSVHEKLVDSLLRHQMRLRFTDIDVDHFGYQQRHVVVAKAGKYLKTLEDQLTAGEDTGHVRLQYTQSLHALGRFADAVAAGKRALSFPTDQVEARDYLYHLVASSLLASEQYRECLTFSQTTARLTAGARSIWHIGSLAAYRLGEYSTSIDLARRALDVKESPLLSTIFVRVPDSSLWMMIGDCLSALARHSEAVTAYDQATALEKGIPDVWMAKGWAQLLDGELLAAHESYRQAFAVGGDSSVNRLFDVLANRLLDQRSEGTNHNDLLGHEAGTAVSPATPYGGIPDVTLWLLAAREFEKIHDEARATQALRQAVSADDESFDAQFSLGLALAHRGDPLAERHLALALQLNPDSVDAASTLGFLKLARGQVLTAANCLATAIRLAPERPEPYRGLASALQALGRPEDAAACWRRAEQLSQNSN